MSTARARVETSLRALPAHCDRDRVAQVRGNLVGNAIQYAPGGEIVVGLRAAEGQALPLAAAAASPAKEEERVGA